MRHLISFTAFPQEALEQDQEDTVAREESAHDEARVHASESGEAGDKVVPSHLISRGSGPQQAKAHVLSICVKARMGTSSRLSPKTTGGPSREGMFMPAGRQYFRAIYI